MRLKEGKKYPLSIFDKSVTFAYEKSFRQRSNLHYYHTLRVYTFFFWSRYFVHAHTFRVDYLSRTATLQLITAPTPDFKLHYGTGVAEYLWAQTQGHPHLIHAICSDLVDYANAKSKNPIEATDVDYILDRQIVLRGEQPFSVFWDEFCESPTMQTAVKAIANGQTVDTSSRDVRRLEEYGYIVKNTEGVFQMRVPLFGRWVRDFGY